MIGSLSTATIALTPAGRAELEQELRLLRLARLPELAARLTDARGGADAWDEAVVLRELYEEQLRLERRAGDLERCWPRRVTWLRGRPAWWRWAATSTSTTRGSAARTSWSIRAKPTWPRAVSPSHRPSGGRWRAIGRAIP
jgi:hypothetical protein